MIQRRKSLDFTSFPNVIKAMIENNAEAATVIDKLIELKGESSSLATLILLDDMNIRGTQIHCLYKLCEEDIRGFYSAVINMTEDGISILNKTSAPLSGYKAVFAGNAEDREKHPEKYIMTSAEREIYTCKKAPEKAVEKDLFPTIKIKDALKTISKKGFICGYEKEYINNHEKETYRVFYNEKGDILQTISQDNKDVFLWEDSKLNVMDNKNGINYVSYIIELKDHPFETYDELLKDESNFVKTFQIPTIKTVEGIKYKHKNPSYSSSVTSSIYDLLSFEKTYQELDSGLKKIFAPLLEIANDIAYNELIVHLNADDGIEIATSLQNILGYSLSKTKLLKAKDRFCEARGHKTNTEKKRFVSKLMSDDPYTKDMNHRIINVLKHDIEKVTSA